MGVGNPDGSENTTFPSRHGAGERRLPGTIRPSYYKTGGRSRRSALGAIHNLRDGTRSRPSRPPILRRPSLKGCRPHGNWEPSVDRDVLAMSKQSVQSQSSSREACSGYEPHLLRLTRRDTERSCKCATLVVLRRPLGKRSCERPFGRISRTKLLFNCVDRRRKRDPALNGCNCRRCFWKVWVILGSRWRQLGRLGRVVSDAVSMTWPKSAGSRLAPIHIKLRKSQLSSDRTSCRSANANQMRLIFHTAAYWLIWAIRGAIPAKNPLRTAEFNAVRLRLLKVAARVIETASRIRIACASACPDASLFRSIFLTLRATGP